MTTCKRQEHPCARAITETSVVPSLRSMQSVERFLDSRATAELERDRWLFDIKPHTQEALDHSGDSRFRH